MRGGRADLLSAGVATGIVQRRWRLERNELKILLFYKSAASMTSLRFVNENIMISLLFRSLRDILGPLNETGRTRRGRESEKRSE